MERKTPKPKFHYSKMEQMQKAADRDKFEIQAFGPCQSSVIFRSKYETFKEAWQACTIGDWMIWLALALNAEAKLIMRTNIKCALTVAKFMQPTQINAIATGIGFLQNEFSVQTLELVHKKAYQINLDIIPAVPARRIRQVKISAMAAYKAIDIYTNLYDFTGVPSITARAMQIESKELGEQNEKETSNICRELLTDFVFEKLSIK